VTTEKERLIDCESIYQQTRAVLNQLLTVSNFRPGKILLLSCSISRVEGRREDTTGDPVLADTICKAVWGHKPDNLKIAVQCCEHLNRALIVELVR